MPSASRSEVWTMCVAVYKKDSLPAIDHGSSEAYDEIHLYATTNCDGVITLEQLQIKWITYHLAVFQLQTP